MADSHPQLCENVRVPALPIARPLLEELALNNTISIFDVALADEDQSSDSASNSALLPTPLVKLTRLKAINWIFPVPGDVHQLPSKSWMFGLRPRTRKTKVFGEEPSSATERT